MLPKSSRLSCDYEFNRVKRIGRGVTSSLFGIYFAPARLPGKTRFGIIISNKLEKKAVRRNRLRRLFRQAIREKVFKNGYDVVIVAFRRSLTASYEELNNTFNKTLSKTPLL